ncbi:MAG: extracellular solute-binding protein [Actinomycetota bacterium]|nr:extracellular solute-binding protein [Actinomycetota bacterium]
MTQPPLAPFSRRNFLGGAALLGGATLLSSCGSPSVEETPAAGVSRPPLEQEPGQLSILEWGGYEAGGTKAQAYGLVAGTDYTDQYGGNSINYTYINNDDQALQKATSSNTFDLMHPCSEDLQDYVSRGLVQPFDTELLASFGELNPFLVDVGQVDGKQYMIPWDWGYGSLLYRKDRVAEADATGWELAWNEKYADKISLWGGASTNFEIAGLLLGFPNIDEPTADEIQQAKQKLIEQKPLNKFYWDSEYGQLRPAFRSGTIDIAYSWQAAYGTFAAKGMDVGYMNPTQGRLSWLCGFMLGSTTKNYYHAHEYVESFINRKASENLVNLYYYGAANTTIDINKIENQVLVDALDLDNPEAISSPDVHLQGYMPSKPDIETAWQEVLAS